MPWRKTCAMDERLKFVFALESGEASLSELCRQFGISRPTGYKWWERYVAEGVDGVQELSRAPHCCPHKVPEGVRNEILALRHRYPTWGPRKIAGWFVDNKPDFPCPAISTIGEILSQAGLVVPRRVRRRTPPRTHPFAKCKAPNDTWSADFKGWFLTGDGTRCDPLTIKDAHSRYLIRCQALHGMSSDDVWPIFHAAFREYGLPRVMRTDNGQPFASTGVGGLTKLSINFVKAGILPERIDPASPQQNGRHERMHGTLKKETADPPAHTPRGQAQRFARFRRYYNTERPHEALGQKTPASAYQASARVYSGRLVPPDYDNDQSKRRVKRNGEISWKGEHIYIGHALCREYIGLREGDDGHWQVHYGPVFLGTLSPSGLFRRPRPAPRRPARGAGRDQKV